MKKIIAYIGNCSNKVRNYLKSQAMKMPKTKTDNLLWKLDLRINRKYMIGKNIDLADRLAHGTIGILKYIELGTVISTKAKKPFRLWFELINKTAGYNKRIKFRNIANALKIPDTLVPIELESSIIRISKNASNQVIRKQFPVFPADAITIHKSQGNF